MSDTIVDMPKVAQMLDAGWRVEIYKGVMGSYEVRAIHRLPAMKRRALESIELQQNAIVEAPPFSVDQHTHGNALMTAGFTPEQALTRMAYKVFGEIL